MKKIAFILALVMVFAVALVACDETPAESTPAESTPVENESTPVESTPDEESVPAESTPDESVPEEESKAPAAEVGALVSVGKAYTHSDLFRQDETYAWNENSPVSYPDEDGVTLTDGVVDPGDNAFSNPVWAGFNANGTPDYAANGYSWIQIDLGAKTDISKIAIYSGSAALGSGISSAGFCVEFLVSDDGENWTSLGTAEAVDTDTVNYIETSIGTTASGQYVRLQFTRSGWMFVSEVEVYDIAK
jgi:hypothetical protein